MPYKHRKDIDGLRAISVLSVILFHFGGMKNGFLGVDIFFVISGYLITKIIYSNILNDKFSILDFYLRRTRRIIPLVLFVNTVVLVMGVIFMLPDDLENLCQSIISTNFFSNNILQLITTKNYWHVVNEYKPLMHTWSLGIEEQFYMIFPFIFIFLKREKTRFIVPLLIALSILSFLLLHLEKDQAKAFYLIQYRFYELCIGGIATILFQNKVYEKDYSKVIVTLILGSLLLLELPIPSHVKILLVVLFSTIYLVIEDRSQLFKLCMENRLISGIGLISFSLYMWHQPLLAFSRYAFIEKISLSNSTIIIMITFSLSIASYFFIEQPFRNKAFIKTKMLIIISLILFTITSSISAYIYFKAGVIKDYPEFELSRKNTSRNMHAQYNDRIYKFNSAFKDSNKIKVLLLGNSFARDWANLLLESNYKDRIEISYIHEYNEDTTLSSKYKTADKVFFSDIDKDTLHRVLKTRQLDTTKYYVIGIKCFGTNNGIYYNHKKDEQYCKQKVKADSNFVALNSRFKGQYSTKYIDLYEYSKDNNGLVPILTYDCKFVSQDCYHFTKAGAKYFSLKLSTKLDSIFQ